MNKKQSIKRGSKSTDSEGLAARIVISESTVQTRLNRS
jgi:hypothetical protein